MFDGIDDGIARDAVFSPDRLYRYTLTRVWDASKAMLAMIGTNPSTASEDRDDPTSWKAIHYARAWGHGGVVMLNAFAWRATDPAELKKAAWVGNSIDAYKIVGPENDYHLLRCTRGRRVLLAWGQYGRFLNRDIQVFRLLRDQELNLVCLGRNKDGSPVHPLYQKNDAQPIEWHPATLHRGPK